jgi:SpoVK/Ycf46/Vps4 family AAA+-type ATPase
MFYYFNISTAVCIIMFEKAESMLNGKSTNAKRICAQFQDCLSSIQNYCRIIVIATTSMPHLIDTSFKQGSRFSYEVIIIITKLKYYSYFFIICLNHRFTLVFHLKKIG